MSNETFRGGDQLSKLLTQYAKKLQGEPTISVGFFSGSTERKTGIPSAYAALLNEYGGSVSVETKNGKTYTRTTPPRPFFRYMIRDGKPTWGNLLGEYLVKHKLNASLALKNMGERMKDELKESIQIRRYPQLAQSTIDKKGHNQTLIDSSDMINAVQYQVDE